MCDSHCYPQLWIQTFDIQTDAEAGRRNTAVRLGLLGSRLLLAVLLLGETAFVWYAFTDWALRSFSASSVGLLALQVALARASGSAPSTELTPETINTTFAVLGLGGVGLMVQVWMNIAFA